MKSINAAPLETESIKYAKAKPEVIPVNFDGIPAELKQHPQWVMWRLEARPEKSGGIRWSKVPYKLDGNKARINRSNDWANYEDVERIYLKGDYDGVGFVFSEEDDLTFVDLDECAIAGEPNEDALIFIERLDTYTELSPSGSGFHCFIHGKKPPYAGCKKKTPLPAIKEIEIYDRARFSTITGVSLDLSLPKIEERQNVLNDICAEFWDADIESYARNQLHILVPDAVLIDSIRSSRQSELFESLYLDGCCSHYGDDHSAADLALCNILAFWTNKNANQMDRIFREGSLYRAKWDEDRGTTTYGERTINKAIESCIEVYSAGEITSFEQAEKMIIDTNDIASLVTTIADGISKSSLAHALKDKLRKQIARKADVSLASLKADTDRLLSTNRKKNQIDIARDAIATFGAENLINISGRFYRWKDNGIWLPTNEEHIRLAVHEVCSDDQLNGGMVDSVVKLLRTRCSVSNEALLQTKFDGINTLSGELIGLNTEPKIVPHNRENYLLTQVPIDYDPSAKAPRFVRFLDEVFSGDPDKEQKKLLVLEMLGYTLTTSCRFEQFIMLIGSGANGKSVLLDIVREMCGEKNVSAVQLNSLDRPFQRAHLRGKLANIVTEVPEGAIINDASLKAVVSGELMNAENKYSAPFEFRPHATFWLGTNHMPHSRDYSDALLRRASIITFNNKFQGANCDVDLKEKLTNELPGILILAVAAFGRVASTGKFTVPASMKSALLDWRMEIDQVSLFLDECCRIGDEEVEKSVLYNAYRDWAHSEGIRHLLKHKSFTNRLKYHHIGERRTAQRRYYTGVVLNNRRTSI